MPFQDAVEVIEAVRAGRTLTYWGSITALHGQPVEFRRLCYCRLCRVYYRQQPRLSLYVPGTGDHIKCVRPTSLRPAPIGPADTETGDPDQRDPDQRDPADT